MAIIHRHATLKPSKTELLADWLPTRPWYRGDPGSPATLVKSGGFRLDDPAGEVGIEFLVVTDTSPSGPVAYLVPLTYRGAPLAGAEHALIGTMEHGVLGTRWTYDGCQDPVLIAELLSLFEGRAQAMAQAVSDTPDPGVIRSYTGQPSPPNSSVTEPPPPIEDRDGTHLPTRQGTTVHVHRVLSPVPLKRPETAAADTVIGSVASGWQTPDGRGTTAVFMTVTG